MILDIQIDLFQIVLYTFPDKSHTLHTKRKLNSKWYLFNHFESFFSIKSKGIWCPHISSSHLLLFKNFEIFNIGTFSFHATINTHINFNSKKSTKRNRNIDRTQLDPISTRASHRSTSQELVHLKQFHRLASILVSSLISLATQIWESKSGQKAR